MIYKHTKKLLLLRLVSVGTIGGAITAGWFMPTLAGALGMSISIGVLGVLVSDWIDREEEKK